MFRRQLRVWRNRVRALLGKDNLDAALDQELAFHFELLVKENIEGGMDPREARVAALRDFGNVALVEEQCRDQRRVTWFHDLRQDLRQGLRILRKNPGFTVVATVSLALGIGANTAILGVMDTVLRGNLLFPNAQRLVIIRTVSPDNPGQKTNASVPDYLAWKKQSRSFEAIGASIADRKDFSAGEDGTPPERIMGQGFAPGLFQALGIQPMLGRVFTEAEAAIDNPAPVIVLSHRLWQRRFAADPNILNQKVRLSGVTLTIIGVMPPSFHYPIEAAEYWIPLGLTRFQLRGSARLFLVTARLKSGVSIEQAQADLESVATQLGRDLPEGYKGWSIRLQPLRDAFFGWTREPLLMLEAAVGLALLIACANVATLLLARASARQPEIAMRVALGAGRGRIVRQLLTESVLLSLMGGALGILVAWWGLRVLVTMIPPPGALRIAEIGLNAGMFAWMVLLSVGTGLLFGVAPAISGFQWNLAGSLKESVSGSGTPASRHFLRGTLVTAQIGLALVLLVGSGLLINSFIRALGRDLSIDPSGLLTFEFRIPQQRYLRNLGSFHGAPYAEVAPSPLPLLQRVYERLRELPGVGSVAGISLPPVNSLVLTLMAVLVEGRSAPENEMERNALGAAYFFVTPNFFATMKTPFLRGRDFDDHDTESAQWVAIVNETMARQFWPGEDPIGKRFMLDVVSGEQPREVIGVVRDIPLRRLQTGSEPVIYTSYLQQPARYRGPSANMFGQMTFLLRSSGNPMNLGPSARAAVAEVDPDVPIADLVTMEQLSGGDMRNRRYYVLVFCVFAAAATVLAAIGIYGVVAYAVAQRSREIGIRMALGASARDLLLMVGGRVLLMIGAGLGIGLISSLALTRLIASELWGVTPTDPSTFAAVSFLLACVALSACFSPLRRALRVDPAATLRTD